MNREGINKALRAKSIIEQSGYLDSLKSEVITKSKEHKQVSNQDILVVDLTPKATKEDNTNIDSDDLPWY